MATKFVYTEIEVQEIASKYKLGTSLETLAKEYNKSVASVRMKLVKLGVYQKQTTAKKTTSAGGGEAADQYETSFKLVGAALL